MADEEIDEDAHQARTGCSCAPLRAVDGLPRVSLQQEEEYVEGEEGDEEDLMDDDDDDEHGEGHEGLDDDDEDDGEAHDDEDEGDRQELELTEAQAAQMAQIARSLGLSGLSGFGRVPMVVQGAVAGAWIRGAGGTGFGRRKLHPPATGRASERVSLTRRGRTFQQLDRRR